MQVHARVVQRAREADDGGEVRVRIEGLARARRAMDDLLGDHQVAGGRVLHLTRGRNVDLAVPEQTRDLARLVSVAHPCEEVGRPRDVLAFLRAGRDRPQGTGRGPSRCTGEEREEWREEPREESRHGRRHSVRPGRHGATGRGSLGSSNRPAVLGCVKAEPPLRGGRFARRSELASLDSPCARRAGRGAPSHDARAAGGRHAQGVFEDDRGARDDAGGARADRAAGSRSGESAEAGGEQCRVEHRRGERVARGDTAGAVPDGARVGAGDRGLPRRGGGARVRRGSRWRAGVAARSRCRRCWRRWSGDRTGRASTRSAPASGSGGARGAG